MRNQILTWLALWSLSAGAAAAADYRGMPAGWPYSSGYYAGYAPANYGSPGVYNAARPVTVAYANPTYLAAYGNAATAYRPTVAAAGYYQQPTTAYYAPAYGTVPPYNTAPAAAYYQPQTAYYPPAYAPQTVQYAPSQSYAISPAGGVSAGSEAAAYYGQPTALNYVPPQFNYRTTYAQVPVYMYRPVTAYYQPGAVQPTTCLQPQTTSYCQPQRSRSWFSWLHPHNWGWFGGGNRSCGYSGCGSPPPTTSYCAPNYTTSYCQPACGTQPYYPVPVQPAPVIQTIPAQPQTTMPLAPYSGTTFPSTTVPSAGPAGPRMPSPPTRSPADTAPRLQTSPVPATTIPSPPGSFTPAPGSLQPSPGGFTPGGSGSFPTAPSSSIQGGGSRSNTVSAPSTTSAISSATSGERPVIRAPELNPPLPPSVKVVPDIDAQQPVAPLNRAPPLLSPRDKTAARGDRRWAVVPAVWPSDTKGSARPVVQSNATEKAPPAVAPPKADRYDDSGWTSGRAW